MAYTEGVTVVSTAIVQDEDGGTTDKADVFFPGGGTIEGFVLEIQEAGTNNAPVVALDVSMKPDESDRAEYVTITPATDAAVNTLYYSDVADGTAPKFPKFMPPGSHATIEHKTAGTANGAYVAHLLVTQAGLPQTLAGGLPGTSSAAALTAKTS